MKVEIWSDIMCPFCFIGKRKFENALAQFAGKGQIELEWKSFQLQPDLKTDTTKNISEHLAEVKGLSTEQTTKMYHQLIETAKSVGLEFNVDKIVVANTFKAQNLVHFAKTQGKQNEIEEGLFKAYFTDGKNVDDVATLIALAQEVGLDIAGLKEVLVRESFSNNVQNDINEARKIGVRGVPFFVFDRKYAVSGAQDPSVFLETLEKTVENWRLKTSN
ncbi:MAG: DsbA family oxidoreductase [Paludibacter sp.]